MSHFQTFRTKLTDAELLTASLHDLSLCVKTNDTVRGTNGQQVQADIVAVLEGDYDIGWSRNAAGSFDLVADLWAVAKEHNQAQLMAAINQKYALKQTLTQVRQRGLHNAKVQVVMH